MQTLKGFLPVALLGLACLPCLALAIGVTGGALSAIGGALLAPAVGVPLLVGGVLLVATGLALWQRRRACALPPAGAAEDTRAMAAPRRAGRRVHD